MDPIRCSATRSEAPAPRGCGPTPSATSTARWAPGSTGSSATPRSPSCSPRITGSRPCQSARPRRPGASTRSRSSRTSRPPSRPGSAPASGSTPTRPPFVYLSASAESRNRGLALAAATEHLANRADIAWAGPIDDIAIDRAIGGLDGAALRAAIQLSVPPGGDGDIFVVPAPSHAVNEDEPRERGTSHGSPWPDDREVPVLFYGPGVAAGEKIEGPLALERVAATLAALLGIAGDWSGPLPLHQQHASER